MRMPSETEIRARIENSRKELLDLSLRNPLLNYRPLSARGVEIVGESAYQVFATLVTDKRSMTFLPTSQDGDDGTDALPWDESEVEIFANQTDRVLQSGETPSVLQKRLLNTYRLANTAIEETGVNTLFLGFGMLRWYESESSQEERLAPLVLVPVRLERTGIRDRFSLSFTGDDLGVNLSLREKVREDFHRNLPGQEVLEPLDGRDIDLNGYIAQVQEVVRQSGPRRWNVEPDRIVLGFFSFNKLLMYLDLGDPSVIHNEIVAALFGDEGFSEPQSSIGDKESVDDRLAPSEVFHVLDADSSQALAIHDAGQGRNMVIQGPPGTGKSQTIANIIAEAVAQGKQTLFVSEKMAALEVVKRRLDNIGLGGACLELHSRKTNKRETLDELSRTLNLSPQPIDSSGEELLDQLYRTRSQLNEYSNAVNVPVGDTGVTPFVAFGELLALQYDKTTNPIARKNIPDISRWSGTDYQRKREAVEDLRLRLQNSGIPNLHPFWGSRLRVVRPDTRTELQAKLETALTCFEQLAAASHDLVEATNLPTPDGVSAAYDLLTASRWACDATDATGLNLKAPQWESEGGRVWDLVELGVRWQWIRRELIHSLSRALDDLDDNSASLANTMRLDHPAHISDSTDLLAAANCAVDAPETDGLDLSLPQWESHQERIRQFLTRGLRWKRVHTEYDSLLLPQAWDTDFQHARLALNTDGRSIWKPLFSSSYKRAKKQLAAAMRGELPRDVDQQVSLIDVIAEEQTLRAEINEQYADIVPVIGRHWIGHNTDWEAIEPAVRWWLGVLAEVASGQAPRGAIQLLRSLEVRLDPGSVQPKIEALSSAVVRYEASAQGLKEVLDVAYVAEQDFSREVGHRSYAQQRQLISRLIEELPTGNHESSEPGANVFSEIRKTPREIASEIIRLHSVVGPVLGRHWDRPDTNWEAIAPAVRWWLDVLAEASAGHITGGVVDLLRDLARETVASDSPRDWRVQTEGLRDALEAYPGPLRELQSAVDMDNQLRFGDSGGLTTLPFSEQRQVLLKWGENSARIQDLTAFNAGAEVASEEGLQSVVAVAAMNPMAAESLTNWFERAWYESIVETTLSERPALSNFDGRLHEGRIERFKSIDNQSLVYNRTRVASAHRGKASLPHQLPERLVKPDSYRGAAEDRNKQQQLRVLQHEIQKRSRHKPIRQLLKEAGSVIQDLKPVFMMSPLSIANYLDQGSVAFDLVVFNEASQVRPVDALGALLRAEKAVVVGDSRQLPPSSFFRPRGAVERRSRR